MTQAAPQNAEALTYQVGVFALVRQRDTVLLVRPHKLLLPGGPQSLPGTILQTSTTGLGVVETALRRTLLSQVGIAVSDLRLVGSHVVRAGSESRPHLRLNMIFGTEYCSGILNPQPSDLKTAHWIALNKLENNVPDWLRLALQELETVAAPSTAAAAPATGGLFSRRRSSEK